MGSIIVTFGIGEQLPAGIVTGCPTLLVDEFDREGVEEALHGRVVVAATLAAHGGHRADRGELRDVGLCRCTAMMRAERVSSTRIWSGIAQPTTFRVARSTTAAR